MKASTSRYPAGENLTVREMAWRIVSVTLIMRGERIVDAPSDSHHRALREGLGGGDPRSGLTSLGDKDTEAVRPKPRLLRGRAAI